ncbi:sodium-independent sulfate anion transporter-like isoform X2 [Oratosquilla oratoria]
MPAYSSAHFLGDMIAGFTISLMIIPQGLAYSVVAGLPPMYGLYSSFAGVMVYALLGTTPELALGPTAMLAILTKQYAAQGGADYAVLLCFTSGIVEVIAGIANLGFLVTYISQPVMSGFTSAAMITIGSTQLKGLFGIKVKTQGVINTWIQVCRNITLTRWQDLVLGLSCMFVVTFLKQIRNFKWKCLGGGKEPKTFGQRLIAKVLFFLSVSRNAAVILVSVSIAYALQGDDQPFTLTGPVVPGLPVPQLPPTTVVVGNETLSFEDIMADVGLGVAVIPFLAILWNLVIATAFTKGKSFDTTQEIIALGAANIVASFFRSMPVGAAMSRAVVNSSSGVRTPAGGLVTGTIVIFVLAFLTPAFSYIPKSTLAAVILCAAVSMVDYEILKPLWRTRRLDLVPLSVTFVVSLVWGLEWGIFFGVGVNLALFLYSFSKPDIEVIKVTAKKCRHGEGAHVLVRPSYGMPFPSCSHFRKKLLKAGLRQGGGTLPVVVDCMGIFTADYSTAKVVKVVVEEFAKRDQPIIFMNLRSSVQKTLCSLCPNIRICSSASHLRQDLIEPSGDLTTIGNADKDNLTKLEDKKAFCSKDQHNPLLTSVAIENDGLLESSMTQRFSSSREDPSSPPHTALDKGNTPHGDRES